MVEITRVLCLISPFDESIKLLRVIIPHHHSEIIQIITFIRVNVEIIIDEADRTNKRDVLPGLNATLILTRASLQSARRYFAFLE